MCSTRTSSSSLTPHPIHEVRSRPTPAERTPHMKWIVATHNPGKVAEARQILRPKGIELISLADLDFLDEPPETGATFLDNALQKARFVFERLQTPCLADDSGIEVAALHGKPGVHSKRFSPAATTDANNALLLNKLAGIEDRRARFRCVIALVTTDQTITAEGSCAGHIAHQASGNQGFGYDPIFMPDDHPGRTMAQLSGEQKNAISHRGRALRDLARRL